MANRNIIGAKGIPNEASNSRGGIHADSGPYIGVVMDNQDATRTGRVRVWLRTHSAEDRNDESNWRTVRYMSPFYGTTPHDLESTAESHFDNNGHAYGMWMTSPDLGVEVLCFFVDGDPNKGYYVGYIPEPQMNHMLPGTGARLNPDGVIFNNEKQETAFTDASQLPTIEMDKSVDGMTDAQFTNRARPIHSVVAAQMWQAGTITDARRGPIGSSAQRESPSYAYGISTPGRPVLAGGLTEETMRNALGGLTPEDLKVQGRRGGHSIVMDDGDLDGNDVLIRFRTSTGHQILMSDDGAAIHIIHANGQTWLELGNEGTVDIYAANSVNIRSQGEINMHADKNVNIHAGENINMYSGENTKIEAEDRFDSIGKKGYKGYSGKDLEMLAGQNLNTHSKQKTSVRADGTMNLDGERIDLNTTTGTNVDKPELIAKNKLDECYFEEPLGWTSWPEELETIVTRAPTHEPYAHHNKGVPVKVETKNSATAADAAPPISNAKVADVSDLPVTVPVTPAEAVKQAQAAGGLKEIGQCTQEQVASVMATAAKGAGQALDAVTEKGIGKFGIQFQALEDLGVIKPGMSLLEGLDPENALEIFNDPAMFTGKLGINNISDILNSESIQADLFQENLDFLMGELEFSGIVNDAMSSVDLGSMLGAAAQAPSLETLKAWATGADVVGGLTSFVGNIPGNVAGAVDDIVDVATNIGGSLASAGSSVEAAIAAGASNVTQTIGNVGANLTSALDGAARNAQVAASMAVTNGKELLDAALSGASSLGESLDDITKLVGTVERVDLDRATDELIGNAKIPSLAKSALNVQNELKLESGQFTGVADAFGDFVDGAGNVISSIGSNATSIFGDVTSSLSSLPTTATNIYSEFSGAALDAFGNVRDNAGNIIGNLQNPATSAVGGAVTLAGGALARGSSSSGPGASFSPTAGNTSSGADSTYYYAQGPGSNPGTYGSNLLDVKAYADTVNQKQGITRNTEEYWKRIYDRAGSAGLTAFQVDKQLGLPDGTTAKYGNAQGLPPLKGYPNFYDSQRGTDRSKQRGQISGIQGPASKPVDKSDDSLYYTWNSPVGPIRLPREHYGGMPASNNIANGNRKVSSAAGSFDMRAYSNQLKAQGRSQDEQAKMMLAKMNKEGLSPKQVDTQMGWPSGTTSRYISDSNGGKRSLNSRKSSQRKSTKSKKSQIAGIQGGSRPDLDRSDDSKYFTWNGPAGKIRLSREHYDPNYKKK